MTGTPVCCRYSYQEISQLNRRRGSTTRAAYQKEATLKRMWTPRDTWADHMGVNCGGIPSDAALAKVHDLGLMWVTFSPEFGWYRDVSTALQELHRIQRFGFNAHFVMQVASHDYDGVILQPGPLMNYVRAFCDGGVGAVTLLNEPNNKNFWHNLDPTFGQVAYLCGQIVRDLRMRFPDLPIYAPGWSPAGGDYAPATAQAMFGRKLQEQHVPPCLFTGASMHPYVYNGVRFGLPEHPEWNPLSQVWSVYEAAKKWGMPGPMSLTEWGTPSAGTQDDFPRQTFDEDYQAQTIADTLDEFLRYRETGTPIEFMAISTAIDKDASTRPIEDSLGLFREDGSEKPAADVVRQFAKREWDLAYSA